MIYVAAVAAATWFAFIARWWSMLALLAWPTAYVTAWILGRVLPLGRKYLLSPRATVTAIVVRPARSSRPLPGGQRAIGPAPRIIPGRVEHDDSGPR
jgi:hypothetical protein